MRSCLGSLQKLSSTRQLRVDILPATIAHGVSHRARWHCPTAIHTASNSTRRASRTAPAGALNGGHSNVRAALGGSRPTYSQPSDVRGANSRAARLKNVSQRLRTSVACLPCRSGLGGSGSECRAYGMTSIDMSFRSSLCEVRLASSPTRPAVSRRILRILLPLLLIH